MRLVSGPRGLPGADGTDGTDGISAYTLVDAQFVMPAEQATVAVTVADSSWMAPGMIVYVQNCGWMEVTAIGSSTGITLKNLEDTATDAYTSNVAPGTAVAVSNKIVAAGLQGPAGTDGTSGAPTDATYVTTQANATLSAEFNLGALTTGMLKHTVAAGVSTPATATDGTDYLSPTTGVEVTDIGTTVQAYDAFLTSIAALGTAANKMIYTTGVDTAAETSLTAYARTLLDDSDAATARATLNTPPGYGILGYKDAVNLNAATTDNAVTMISARYRIEKVMLESPSAAVTTATMGVFTAAGGGGTTLAADQALSGTLTGTTKFMDLVLQAITGTDTRTEGTLYIRTGTAEGAARTVNVKIYGWKFD